MNHLKTPLNNISFLDMLFIFILGMFILYFLTSLLIRPHAIREADIKKQVAVLVTIEWPEKSDDDVDLWVESPNGDIVFFRDKEKGLMNLERDDLGVSSDTIRTEKGKVIVYLNVEHVNIRKLIDGWYTVNIHMFLKRDKNPIIVKTKIEKFSSYKLINVRKLTLSESGEEKTVARFLVRNGQVVGEVKYEFKKLFRGELNVDA